MSDAAVARSAMRVSDEVRAVLMAHGRTVRARKGQIVLSIGLPANDVFLVVEGRASVTLVSALGRETVLRSIGPDEIFGELAAIDGGARAADVVASQDCLLAVIPGARFVELLESDARVGLWLARYLCRQVRYLTGKVYELANMSVGARLLAELLRIAENHPEADGMVTIVRPPTQAELAARIGTNRETVTRELSLLLQQGLIGREGRQILIPSLARLAGELRHLSPGN